MANEHPWDAEPVINLQHDESLVEIDPSGRISRVGDGGQPTAGKRTVLHDPKGEYDESVGS